jgi:rhodanese-related sulfurtransferase
LRLREQWWLPFGGVPEISSERLHRWIQEDRPVQLVDARTAFEFQQGTVSGAQHAPLTGLPDVLERLELNPEQPVVFLCLSGHRSRPGTRLLRSRGFEAYSLRGGIMAWRRAGYALEEPESPPEGSSSRK